MIQPTVVKRTRRRTVLPMASGSFAGFVLAVVALGVIGVVAYRSLVTRTDSAARVTQTLRLIGQVEALSATVTDAETGQRGYLLTGQERYLAPFNTAQVSVPATIARLRELVKGNPEQSGRLEGLEQLSRQKFDELNQTISMRRSGDTTGAVGVVLSDRGMVTMDRFRALVGQMEDDERAELASREAEWEAAINLSSAVDLGRVRRAHLHHRRRCDRHVARLPAAARRTSGCGRARCRAQHHAFRANSGSTRSAIMC